MKAKEMRNELRQLTIPQLQGKIEELRKELLTLRLQTATTPLASYASTKKQLRHAIACGLTLMRQKSA